MVIAGRKGPDSRPEVEALLATLGLRVVPLTDAHARLATDAFLRWGKGRHPAGLNFGDCMAYAVAKAEGAPLLFTGGDFARTDVAGGRWWVNHPSYLLRDRCGAIDARAEADTLTLQSAVCEWSANLAGNAGGTSP